jgi:CRISPR-associated protein Csb1
MLERHTIPIEAVCAAVFNAQPQIQFRDHLIAAPLQTLFDSSRERSRHTKLTKEDSMSATPVISTAIQQLSFEELKAAVCGAAAAFRSTTKLQPVGGEGDKVFPVTYSGGVYATERRALDGRVVDCVLIDSVQSQANRAEEALKLAIERGRMQLPVIEVDFQGANGQFRSPLPNLTSLDVPHRLADAILRDSVLADGTRFSKSEYAQQWGKASLWNAAAIYELCPTALVFGMWGSPEKPGGLGAKFERAFVSEIVAIDVIRNTDGGANSDKPRARGDLSDVRAGFRVDPLNSSKNVAIKQNDDGTFQVGAGKLRPSEINHGNIIFETPNCGVRFRYAEQTTVVSLGALRKLRFPLDGKDDPRRNDAGRTVLAALGLCAGVLASEMNTSLRSRCHLWPVEEREWELLDEPGRPPRKFQITGDQAIALLGDAVGTARQTGLQWMEQTLTLKPSPELVDLVRQSQELAAKEKGEGDAS